MWELLLSLVENHYVLREQEIPKALKNYKSYKRYKNVLKNPPLAVKNLLKSKLRKTDSYQRYNDFQKKLNISNQKNIQEITRFFNTYLNIPKIKNKFLKQFKVKNMAKEWQYSYLIKDVPISVFIGLKSSWVSLGMWIPVAKIGKRYYGVMRFSTKSNPGKFYDVFNFELTQWEDIRLNWTTPYGHGAGSYLWAHKLIHHTKGKTQYRRKAKTLLKKPFAKTATRKNFNNQATSLAKAYLQKTQPKQRRR